MIGLNEKNIGSNEKMIGLNKKNNRLNTVKGNKEEQYEVIEHLKLIAEPAKNKNAAELWKEDSSFYETMKNESTLYIACWFLYVFSQVQWV